MNALSNTPSSNSDANAAPHDQGSAVRQKTFDDILDIIGNVGRLQKRILLTVAFVAIATAYQNFIAVFSLRLPSHRCSIPDYSNDSFKIQSSDHATLVNLTIPVDDSGKMAECSVYGSRVDGNQSERSTLPCSSWVYDTRVFDLTLAMDLNLVCDAKILRSHSNMMMFAGKFLGAILQGFASDIFGRRRVLIVTSLGILCGTIGNAFVSSVATLLALRFFTGFMTTAGYLVIFVICIEFTDPGHRAASSTIARLAFALGQMSLTLLAYFIRDWRYLQMATAWPAVLLCLVVWTIPESPRWLLSKNRLHEAEKIIQRAGKINKKTMPPNVASFMRLNAEHQRVKAYQLFGDIKLVIRWCVIYVNWLVITMVYYGITLNVSNLSGNIFLNYFLIVLVDVIATSATSLIVNRTGRKYLHISAMLLAGGACTAAFIPVLLGSDKLVVTVLSLAGKFGVSAAFFLIYMYTAELFPTAYRAFGMGSSSMIARIGGMASPYVADLNTYFESDFGAVLPQLVFGGAGILGGLLVFLLPETKNQQLPETIQDAKQFDVKKDAVLSHEIKVNSTSI